MNRPDDFMRPLRLRYLVQLRDRRGEVSGFLQGCENGEPGEESRADMRKKIHRLAGSAATYGYPWISSTARTLETALDARMDPPKLAELARALLREYDRALGSRNLEASR